MEPVLRTLLDAAAGRFPPADLEVEIVPRAAGRALAAVLAFSGHHVIATDLPDAWVRERLPPGDLIAPLAPPFLHTLELALDARANSLDVTLAAPGLPGRSALVPTREHDGHGRVARALGHRDGVSIYAGPPGVVVVLGDGLAGRREVAVEVDPPVRGRGLARAALLEARRLLAPAELLFAQTAPGNAASLRALLAAGLRPLGSEVLLFPSQTVDR